MTTPPSRHPLTSTHRQPPTDSDLGPADPEEQTSVSIYVRPRTDQEAPTGRVSREDWAAIGGADPVDLDAVAAFAREHGLTVTGRDLGRRLVVVTGRVADLSAAFGTELRSYRTADGTAYRGRRGPLSVPAGLADVVVGVFGLDTRPQARTHLRAASAQAISYPPTEVAAAYAAPTGTGTGQCVGILELGGGYSASDLSTYFSGLGLATPTVTAVSVDGGTNAPGGSADAEVMLDIEVVGCVANGAHIAVYFAPNTDQGFLDAVTQAIHDTTNKPSVLSISWGGPESTWTAQAMTQMEQAFTDAATLGVTVTVAAGDNGSTDGVNDGQQHVDFPASAPHALACGGTTLELSGTATDPSITSEVVWNDLSSGDGATGGGVSAQFPLPSFQASAGVPVSANPGGKAGRGVPDVAGDADPETGYAVRVDGSNTVVGGTSAVAPLWAGLVAVCNASLGRDVGYLNPTLYGLAPSSGAFHDITSGSNGAYQAKAGWDPCTGLGSPDGQALLTSLQAAGTTS